ncbi:hypothetical protein [Citrobacter koseri]|uniref:hypothetical protein n=1 Tax=Citrobacter koseri TaxID=545 RepID=UPI000DFADC10|nr:hypothetical protein [Citrobacter koseri]STB73272.1 Uncharacterised protein [Citrobacter koseri]STT23452.1 Uncharacterised protein [Citrobacter koseri]
MLFLRVIYHTAVFADRIVSFIAPRTLLAGWFFWFTDDAKTLLLVGRELELARAYRECLNPDELVAFTVYHSGVFFGEREVYGLRERWPRWFLHHFEQSGMQLNPLQWKTGCVDGFRDKAAPEQV